MSKTDSSSLRNTDQLGLIAVIVLLGLNLRPVLASVGPVLDQIQAATGLGHTGAGMLTTLPVLAMGLGALAGNRLYSLLGTIVGIRTGIILIALACAARAWANDAAGLILTALAAGAGIACVQTLLPAFIREHFREGASRAMGIYSTAIMGGAAVAAAATPWLAAHDNWPHALASWGLPAAIAAAIWWRMLPRRASSAGTQTNTQIESKDSLTTNSRTASHPETPTSAKAATVSPSRAWLLMSFFGVGTAAYTLVLAWLPPFYTALGWTSAQSGLLLGAVTLMEVTAGLLVSALIGHFPDRRPALAAVLIALLLGIGGLFPLSLIVTLDHAPEPAQAGRLLGFVQGGGYLIASAMPLAAGALRAALGQLDYAWMLMAGGTVVLFLMAMRLKPLK
jgi:CP family cyanate transporter-like MFS transporter